MSVTQTAGTTRQDAPPAEADVRKSRRRRRVRRLTGSDRVVIGLMIIIPSVFVIGLVWLPALVTVWLSFTNYDGFEPITDASWVGLKNFHDVITTYPPFVPAIQHNLMWLGVMFLVATPFGVLLAVLLDREIRYTRFYRSSFYLPVVLSLALVGFIWQLIYSRDQGLLNAVLGLEGDQRIDWYGDPKVNIWAVMVAAAWRHAGYVMLLYLAGLKGVDPDLREAASMDGAGEFRTFFQIILPVMRPINIIVLVVTVIESLRAFDLVWVINRGRNGLELISALVTSNIVGEGQRIGFGSALATIMLVISLVFVVIFLATTMRGEKR